jgi:hypothetical protein
MLVRAVRAAQRPPVPELAIKHWPIDRLPDETPVTFVRRVYGKLIDRGGMTQADLAKIDKKTLNALRNYCGYREARPKRPRTYEVLPPGRKSRTDIGDKFPNLTYQNSLGAWLKNPTPENLERKRAYLAMLTQKSRGRHNDPT